VSVQIQVAPSTFSIGAKIRPSQESVALRKQDELGIRGILPVPCPHTLVQKKARRILSFERGQTVA
jgi:hypothetical protein